MISDMSKMPFGKYKGREMLNVPGDYLLFIYKNFDKLSQDIKDYIKKNMDAIIYEIEYPKKYKKDKNYGR